jgi:hypothetical protein
MASLWQWTRLAMFPSECRCATSSHTESCGFARILEHRRALFAGLFDEGEVESPVLGARNVRLLDPEYPGDDPASRRFALIETD